MTLSNLQKFGIAAGVAVAAMGANFSDAYAQGKGPTLSQLPIGKCMTRSDLTAHLIDEGQSILVAHDAVGYSGKTGEKLFTRELFTADQKLKTGYHMSANISGDFCKSANLSNIKLFDARTGKIDSRAYYTPVSYSSQGTLNNSINSSLKTFNAAPVFQADAADNGVKVTVIANIKSGEGVVLFSKANGQLTDKAGYSTVKTSYSPVATKTLDQPKAPTSLVLAVN